MIMYLHEIVSFPGHTPLKSGLGTRRLTLQLIVPQVLVHGEQNEMARLKAALLREHEDNEVGLLS